MKRLSHWISVSLAFVIGGLLHAARPNIILIMSDDMGFSDLGCYGGEIHTPNLDSLAAEGLRLTQFYNCARCCPTRAALLTGLYPHQAGIGHMMQDRGWPAYRGDLSPHCVTIAQVLKQAGYATYMVGKWHVTRFNSPEGPKHNWPRQRGFDRFFGTLMGAGSYYDPATLTLDNTQIPPWKDFYYTDAISDFAVRCIREHDPSKPFFMYVAYTAAHWPLHAREKDIQKYHGKYDVGWDEIRERRYQRLLKMGVIKPEWGLSPRDPQVPPWKEVPEAEKPWHARCMEVYAAQVECMDRGIGRIVEALKQTGQFENTVIFFLQDNGGCAESIGRGRPRRIPKGSRPLGPKALQQRIVPWWTRDGRPVRQGKGVMPGPADTYLSYGRPWANTSNTPFREYKHWVHEGGIATPLIVHWPAGIPKKLKGTFIDTIGHVIDIMPTCIELAGAHYPKSYNGLDLIPLEGISLVPLFQGKEVERSKPLFWEHEGNRAVRWGKWKLVAKNRRPWELYNMEYDRSELHDLSSQYPQIVEKLRAAYQTWARRCGVRPWPVHPPRKKEQPKQRKSTTDK